MTDLIDRQAAIDAICELHIYGKSAIFGEYNENSYAEHLHDAVKAIEELPSAQPEHHAENLLAYAHDMGVTLEQAEKELQRVTAQPWKGET